MSDLVHPLPRDPDSGGRIALRASWGVLLTLVAPGLGLVFAGFWGVGVAVLVVEDLVSLGTLAVTRFYPPTTWPFAVLLGTLVLALLFRVGCLVAVVRRLRRGGRVRPRWWRSTWVAAALMVGVSVGQNAVLPPFGWRSFSVPSGSMIPTLQVGDYFLADVRAPGERPQQGDIVVFTVREPAETVFVKRVIGLSGDQVAVRQGHLTLNNRPTPLRALPPASTADGEALRYGETLPSGRSFTIQKLHSTGAFNDTPDYIVPPGNLFMMGDNRDNSMDSRALGMRFGGSFGFVPVPDVLGTATMLFWPPSRAFTLLQ